MKSLVFALKILCTINFYVDIYAKELKNISLSILTISLDNQYYKNIGGYPPDSRNRYLPVVNKAKKINTSIVYFDAAFIRKPTPSEKNFAKLLNAEKSIVIPAPPSYDETTENYAENAGMIGKKIITSKLTLSDRIIRIPGIKFPYHEMVIHSRATAVSFSPFEEDFITRYLPLYANFEGNIYQSVALVLANMYLKKEDVEIEYDSIKNRLNLVNLETRAVVKTLHSFDKADSEIKIPISFRDKIETLSAVTFLNQSIDSMRADIVIIGTTADGMSNKLLTPIGQISGSQLLAHEIYTLIDLVNKAQ